MGDTQTIQPCTNVENPRELKRFCDEVVSQTGLPIVQILANPPVLVVSTYTVTAYVANRRRRPIPQCFVILITLGESQTVNTFTVTTGRLVRAIDPNEAWIVATNETGQIVVEVFNAAAETIELSWTIIGIEDVFELVFP